MTGSSRVRKAGQWPVLIVLNSKSLDKLLGPEGALENILILPPNKPGEKKGRQPPPGGIGLEERDKLRLLPGDPKRDETFLNLPAPSWERGKLHSL